MEDDLVIRIIEPECAWVQKGLIIPRGSAGDSLA